MRKELLISMSALALIASAGNGTAQEKGGPGGAGGQTPAAQQPASPGGGGRIDSGSQPSQQPRQEDFRDNRAQNPSGKAQAQDQRAPQRDNQNRAQQDRPASKGSKGDVKADSKSRQDTTTGQGAAGSSGGASLTTEQRTKISTTIRQSNVRPVTNVNFNISVGTVVPRSVTLHALPAAVIEVYPEWRPYRFILVGDEILVIDPATHRIVAILDA
jgi:hypothetical protein